MKTETRVSHLEEDCRALREQLKSSLELIQSSDKLRDIVIDDPRMRDTIEKIAKSSTSPEVLLDLDRCNRKISALKDEFSSLQNQVAEIRTKKPTPIPASPVATVVVPENPQVISFSD